MKRSTVPQDGHLWPCSRCGAKEPDQAALCDGGLCFPCWYDDAEGGDE